jgi:hypothetical protein
MFRSEAAWLNTFAHCAAKITLARSADFLNEPQARFSSLIESETDQC